MILESVILFLIIIYGYKNGFVRQNGIVFFGALVMVVT